MTPVTQNGKKILRSDDKSIQFLAPTTGFWSFPGIGPKGKVVVL